MDARMQARTEVWRHWIAEHQSTGRFADLRQAYGRLEAGDAVQDVLALLRQKKEGGAKASRPENSSSAAAAAVAAATVAIANEPAPAKSDMEGHSILTLTGVYHCLSTSIPPTASCIYRCPSC